MGTLSWLKRRRRGSTLQKPLRLWPGVAAAVLLLLLRFGLPLVWGEAALVSIVGGLACAVLILVWWVFFSRAPWIERIGALVVIVAAVFAVWPFLDKSIATAMMGRLVYVYALPPVVAPALVAWAVATRHLSNGLRRATMVLTIFLACGFWTLFRTEGIKGGSSQVTWRWTRTAEERLLAATEKPAAVAPAPAPAVAPPTSKPAEWPGFRGKDRDSVIHGVRIETDWSASPPVQIWRRPIGPGWSSFAVQGDRLYTQEQRGDDELVSSYRVSTGEPVWRHRDTVRFWESNGGAGPRGTPTLSNGRVFTFGATGILNALDAGNGAVAWSRNLVSETGAKIPMYGFAGSPLVLDDLVIVAVSGRLAAFDAATGTKRWVVASSGGSYSSPHLATLDGVPQIVLLNAGGAKSVMPADGTVLWEVAWPGDVTIVQPAVIGPNDILITTAVSTGGVGTRRLAVSRGPNGWKAEERWTSNGLKPYFNDYVVHNGHAFGFDGAILSCVDLADGKRKWKGGRYGNGQLVLLADQDVLLVMSEEGELALVAAATDEFRELARFKALDAKTWNHPVVIRDLLLIRNGEEMAAFRLPRDGG